MEDALTAPLFDPLILDPADYHRAVEILGSHQRLFKPDLTIAPDGTAYLYRWYVTPRSKAGNVYFHIQVQSDPERPLHDHPWDNQSVILAGGYLEQIQLPPWGQRRYERRRVGDVIHRGAKEAHRLILPDNIPYTMTLFTTGPSVRDWGFWIPTHRGRPDWVSHKECIVEMADGRLIFKEPVR